MGVSGASPLNRAYSFLEVKTVDAEKRTFSGMATTPSPDRVGDVIEPLGVQFSNPSPLLLYHDTEKPVGQVTFGKPTSKGVPFTASIPDVAESGTLQDRVNEAWQSVKYGLVKAVSVGFKELKGFVEPIKNGGWRYLKTEVLELSLVVIPANAEAVITTVKSLDAEHLAASGAVVPPVTSPSAGVSAIRAQAQTSKHMTTAEQISSFEATRAAKAARMVEIMQKAGESGVTLDAEQEQEYDALEVEVKSIDNHLTRLTALEKANAAAAKPVNGSNPEKASDSRGGVVTVKSNLPPGTGFTRFAMALAASRGSRYEAIEYAKRWQSTTPEITDLLKIDASMLTKAAMTAGTVTDSDWAAPLVVFTNLASEFVALSRPQTILGRIPGLRGVPFNTTMPTQTQGATANWVGEGKPKPVSELKFGQISLGMFKAAGIVVLSEELVRSSSPSAEAIVRQDLIATIAQFLDEQFINPANAGSANVSPAAITNGITPVDSTGVTYAHLSADFKTLAAQFTAANLSLAGSVWLMTETQALALSLMQNALGQPQFPNMTVSGGTFFGLPVVVSENIPAEGGSPAGNRIILIKANEIYLADEGGVMLDVSREASLQMDSAPDDPATASTVMVSLWQNNLVGLRVERFINWKRRRAEAVGIIEGAVYTG